jgi:predicted nucleic acid-binding Zn ribbon protein
MRSRQSERCMRCGGPVQWDRSVCHRCNPGNLPSPSRTQFHATMFGAVFLPLVVIGLWLIIRG